MLSFYFSPGSSSMAPHIALHEVGAIFDAKPVSFARKEHESPEFRAINPEGKVPALLIDGRRLTEVVSNRRAPARERHRSRGPGGLLDVFHRLIDPSGTPARARACSLHVRARRPATG